MSALLFLHNTFFHLLYSKSFIQQNKTNQNKSNLNGKVFDLRKSLQELNDKMQNEIKKLQSVHAKDRNEWENRERDLLNNLTKAKKEHKKAMQQVTNLKTEIESLNKDVTRINLQATIEMDKLRASHDKAITNMQTDALEVQNNLEIVNSNLETKLHEEKQSSDKLRLDLSKIQKDAAEEIQSIKQKSTIEMMTVKNELNFHKKELEDRNSQIEELYKERSRIRSLAKIQLRLVKSRIKKRFKKIFKRDRK